MDPPAKPWWQSRTLWLNVLSLVVVVATALVDTELVVQHPRLVLALMAAVNVANALLRFLTTQPLTAWLLALTLCLASAANAADVVLPTAGKLVGVVITDEPGDWGVLAADLSAVQPQVREDGRVCVFEGTPGRYAVIKVPKGGGLKISTVVLGGAGPVVVPPHPGPTPTPEPTPTPTPPPVVSGPRGVTIIREAREQTHEFGSLIRDLRSGAAEKYLRDKGHDLLILDSDQLGPDRRPSALVQQWLQVIAGMPQPVLVVYEPKSRNVLHKESLPKTLGDANVILDSIRRAGG